MWSVYEEKKIKKVVRRVPKEVLKNYEIWKRIVELEGPAGLRLIKGFHDELLRGKWKGYRSSRLNKQWRIIYRMESYCCEVYVIEINAHNY